jgi:hypothetical protein
VRVEAHLSGGKIPRFDETVSALRSGLKACADGKGAVGAQVEFTLKIDPKGKVQGADKVGGSEFEQGVMACLTKRIESATFEKPAGDAGTPHATIRVVMAAE